MVLGGGLFWEGEGLGTLHIHYMQPPASHVSSDGFKGRLLIYLHVYTQHFYIDLSQSDQGLILGHCMCWHED